MEKEEFLTEIHKEVKIQASQPKEGKEGQRRTPQYFIQIPKEVVLELGLDKGDLVVMKIPLKDKSKYSIKFKKIK